MNSKKITKVVSSILLCTMTLYTAPVFGFTKDETVYTKYDSNGKAYKTIVSTHLKNDENEEILKDMSNLLNIKNTNGDETFKQDGNSLIWNANKTDIYYQGETDKELPIDVNIKYELDGKEMSANEIVGKKGKIKVIISYTNKDEHMVNVNGKNVKMYTPFVVVAGTIIKNDNNRNINITNGKVIDDGNKTVVLGLALPGLQESLNISKDKVEIPNTIEITMESDKFEMGSVMSYVTPKVIEKEDLSIFDEIEDLYQKVDTLSSSSKQILDGANTFKNGTETYSEKIQEFESAMKQVSDGMTSANSNYSKINEGIKTLNTSSSELNAGSKQVTDGISQVEANLNTVNEKLGEILNGSQSLQDGEKQIIAGIDTIIAKLNALPTVDNSSKITELKTLIQANQGSITKLTTANTTLQQQYDAIEDVATKEALKAQIDGNNSMIQLLQANIQALNSTAETLTATDSNSIQELKAGLSQVKSGLTSLKNGTDTLTTGIGVLKEGTNTLAQKTGELGAGANSLYQGTNKLVEGTSTLKTGSEEMKKGLSTLDNGGSQILSANKQLVSGASTINEGAQKLAEGIDTFNKEGINKICDYINSNVKDIVTRVDKLSELSLQYNNFAMLEEGTNGNTKFIMIIDALKEENKKENAKEKAVIDFKSDSSKEKEEEK